MEAALGNINWEMWSADDIDGLSLETILGWTNDTRYAEGLYRNGITGAAAFAGLRVLLPHVLGLWEGRLVSGELLGLAQVETAKKVVAVRELIGEIPADDAR